MRQFLSLLNNRIMLSEKKGSKRIDSVVPELRLFVSSSLRRGPGDLTLKMVSVPRDFSSGADVCSWRPWIAWDVRALEVEQ